MKYLMRQFDEVKSALRSGAGIKDALAIKWYVQQLMAEQIERYLSPCSSVLELGCGGSLTLHFLSLRGHRVTGVDNNPDCLRYADALRTIFGSPSELILADAADLPLRTGQFDYVYSVGMLEHYPLHKQRLLFDEMVRVARQHVHVEVPNPHPLSTFYTVGLRSEEVHLPCNPGLLMAESRCGLPEVDGRCVFNTLGELKNNPPLHAFVRERAPHLLADSFAAKDIEPLCAAERAISRTERLVYGFQLSWIAPITGFASE